MEKHDFKECGWILTVDKAFPSFTIILCFSVVFNLSRSSWFHESRISWKQTSILLVSIKSIYKNIKNIWQDDVCEQCAIDLLIVYIWPEESHCLENPFSFVDQGLSEKTKAGDQRQIFTVAAFSHRGARTTLKKWKIFWLLYFIKLKLCYGLDWIGFTFGYGVSTTAIDLSFTV